LGVWALGLGALAPTPHPPIPNPQSPIPNHYIYIYNLKYIKYNITTEKNKFYKK
jgi:hypothetical protein